MIISICFFHLVTGQKFRFQSVRFKDECTTALIAVEVEPTGSFQLVWYAVRRHVNAQIALITFTDTGTIHFHQVDNKLFSSSVYEFSVFLKFFPHQHPENVILSL